MKRLVSIALILIASAVTAAAQTYPSKSVRVIVPFAPGGPTDIFARLIAQKLSERTHQQFYVEDMSGAGGNIGTARVAQAAPDGYTLLVTGGNHTNNPSLYAHNPYDPIKDFAPITVGANQPVVIAVNPSVPAKTLKELIELIRANPGKYSYASPGVGTPPQLVGELFRLQLKLDVTHVPFGGGGPAVQSAVAGHTPISFGAMAPAVELIKAGKLRALAVTTKTRSQALPDVPTTLEAGYPYLDGTTWTAVLAPAATPKEIVVQLNRMIVEILGQTDVKQKLAALGSEPVGNSPEETLAFFKGELAKWSKVIQDAGIKPR
jgi:tripartite-type tricarboxylate transporter receptor subunit TctC